MKHSYKVSINLHGTKTGNETGWARLLIPKTQEEIIVESDKLPTLIREILEDYTDKDNVSVIGIKIEAII